MGGQGIGPILHNLVTAPCVIAQITRNEAGGYFKFGEERYHLDSAAAPSLASGFSTGRPLTSSTKILNRSRYRHHLPRSRISAAAKRDPPKGGGLTPHTRLLAKSFGIEAVLDRIRQYTEQSPRT
jgi:hypothetical protein